MITVQRGVLVRFGAFHLQFCNAGSLRFTRFPPLEGETRNAPQPNLSNPTRADPIGRASPERGCTGIHDCSGAPPMRSQRERASRAAPPRQNELAESAR
jgi:hypothetical protein